ncbi:HNH endonuclease signature motif containing protein [Pseudobutyrivibrio xylanivorans]|uniref:HNH endonuclease signature motif containing protein n=1 Tax=Pseudobutyrivibrio xylanivorans TaxID=185007 RepID=UPI001FA95E87|nr:HNH endonuclease signature motif containing protein [Pseudobutyrivibrio xylanivorans]
MDYCSKIVSGYPAYEIDTRGQIFSYKSGKKKQLKPTLDSKQRYYAITLCSQSGNHKKFLIHRLVALAFIPNPNDYGEVNHIDGNPQNNNVENLEWCDRKHNLAESYKTMSPVRNKNASRLYKGDEYIGDFESISAAIRYAKEKFKIVSVSSLHKYLQYGDIRVIPEKQGRKHVAKRVETRTQNKGILILEGEGITIKRNTVKEIADDVYRLTGRRYPPRSLCADYNGGYKIAHRFSLKRVYEENYVGET